jgi:hypothetical protein
MLSAEEETILKELVEAEDEYVVGACELYTQDGRLGELLDTLTRKVRHEAKIRATAQRTGDTSKQEAKETGVFCVVSIDYL